MPKLTRIQLIGDLKGYLDVEEKTVFPISYGIAEIRDLSKKKGTYSKSIILAGTKNNNKLLNHYFDVNVVAGEATFDINKLTRCNVIQDGVTILENMLIQLTDVETVQSNNSYHDDVKYTVLVKDVTSDFFGTIDGKLLTDPEIDFSYLNHTFNADNVIASFTNTNDSGFLGGGFKYVMPYNPSTVDDITFALAEFNPGIYAKQYFDKIFSSAGYSYTWPSMDSPSIQFSKLIIPYNGDVPAAGVEEFGDYEVVVQKTGATAYGSSVTFNNFWDGYDIEGDPEQTISIPIVITDINGDYDSATSTYTSPDLPSLQNNTKYTIEVDFEVNMVNNEGTFIRLRNMDNNLFQLDHMSINPLLILKKNSSVLFQDSLVQDLENNLNLGTNKIYIKENQIFNPGTTQMYSGTRVIENTVLGLTPDDEIVLRFKDIITNSSASQYVNFYTNDLDPDIATFYEIQTRITGMRVKIVPELEGEYGYNVTLDMNKFRPAEIKQSDFVKSIFTMFNLFCEVNKDNPNNIIITPRNEFYDAGAINDWTKKLVKDKPQTLRFLPELQNKKYLLTYKKEEEDPANKAYTEATNQIWGQLEYTFDNEYVKDKTTSEIIFGPTPMFNTLFGAVLPMINGQAPNTEPRILIDGGAYYCGQYSIYDTNTLIVSGNTYPHISHWDKPLNPTFDLNFGDNPFYFRSDDYGAKTNNNLFNLHWRRTLSQINNGKMFTALFQLNAVDIARVRMNDKIRIDNSWWNINRVIDYDANSNAPTKVELISIDEGLSIPFVTRNTRTIPRHNHLFNVINQNSNIRDIYLNNNLSNGNTQVQGQNNFIAPTVSQATIQGNTNILTANANVTGNNNNVNSVAVVIGDNNTVDAGLYNTFVVGNSISATTNNTLYTNNITMSTGATLNGISIETIISGATEPDIYLTGGTFSANTLTLDQANGGPSVVVTGFTSGGGGVSITGGTYTTGGTLTLTNTTGGTVSVTGFTDSQLQKITETSQTGWRLLGKSPARYGDIGVDAIDFSHSSSNSSTRGATGAESFATGRNTRASGIRSFAAGNASLATGDYSAAFGGSSAGAEAAFSCGYATAAGDASFAANGSAANSIYSFAANNGIANGQYSAAFGYNSDAESIGEMVVGYYPDFITGDTTTWQATDAAFRVGISNQFGSNKDGFRVYKGGALYIDTTKPSSGYTNSLKGMIMWNSTTNRLASYNTSWKDYLQVGDAGFSELQKITEASKTGWRLLGMNPANYGNIGTNAVDFSSDFFGASSTRGATGDYSAAFGQGSTASGLTSFAAGLVTQATGDYSVAMGGQTLASGSASVAMGSQATSSGQYSVAMGSGPTASNIASVAMGENSSASGRAAAAFGSTTTASGNNSFAFGNQSSAQGQWSFAGGNLSVAIATGSTALGIASYAGTWGEAVVGPYPVAFTGTSTGSSSSFQTNDTSFRVGIGSGPGSRTDGFRVYKSGKVEITQAPAVDMTAPSVLARTSTGEIVSQPVGTFGYVAKTANYTAAAIDYMIDCTANTFQVTLPTAVGIAGKIYIIKNSASGTTVTIGTTSSQTIDGSTTKLLNAQYAAYTVMSDGANWKIISSL